jgi:replication factor A1
VLKLKISQTECAIIGSPKNYSVQSQEKVQDPHLLAVAGQKKHGNQFRWLGHAGGILLLQGHSRLLTITIRCTLWCSRHADFFHRPDIRTDHNNVQTVVPYHNNMFTGGFYGTTSTQKIVNASMVEKKSQQPSLRSHHNQLLVLVA